MVKRLTVVFVLFVFAMLIFNGGAFATTSKKLGAEGKAIRHISEDVYPPEFWTIAGSNYQQIGFKDSADCFALIPDEDIPAVTEHDCVGRTFYEFQKNGSMGRMISVTGVSAGGNAGMRHVSWMWSPGVYPGNVRGVLAWSKPDGGAWTDSAMVGNELVNSGYSNQAHFNDGTSVVIFHQTGLDAYWSCISVDDYVGAGAYGRVWDLPDNIVEASSGEVGAWPKASVMYCLDETVHPDPLNYIHIIEQEGATDPGVTQEIAYLRCYIKPTQPAPYDTLVCQTPNESAYEIKANETFQDDVHSFDNSCDLSATIVTGRGIMGKKVAIAYMPLAVAGDCDFMNDVGYVECQDNGDAWIAGGADWPPTIHKLTNYGMTGGERAFHDMSACYDYDDSLHIVWVNCGWDASTPGSYYPGIAYLYHWSEEYGISLIASKVQEGANPMAHNVNIGKPSLSAKDPELHPGGDSSYMYCIWMQVDSSDQNEAKDKGNADIYGSGSFDGGETWGKVYNLTGTHTPGCKAGYCVSEVWPSMAENMYMGDLHIEYICDRDAGGAIMDEGTWTENFTMYMRLPEWIIEAGPRGTHKITEPTHWYHPPVKVLPNDIKTIKFKLFSIGNEDLSYSVTSAHPCIQVVASGDLAPRDSIEINVELLGTGACNNTFIAGSVILSTNEAGGLIQELRVHAVVSDDYYECPRDPETVDTLQNDYALLYVNSACQQWVSDTVMTGDTLYEVFFQGGTIVATTDVNDTLVGRFMGDNDLRGGSQQPLYVEQCEPDWEPHFWILYTNRIYIEASHLTPPSHFKWFWWEVQKQVKFFKPTAPEEYQHIVIKYIKVKRMDPPGWWPDLTPFTDYEDTYIGMAMDIDCPYDSSATGGGPEPFLGDESACNKGYYDATNNIAYQTGFGRTGEHPEYNDYHAGMALANGGELGESEVPFATANVKNNQYLYPTSPWGWKDGELYELAKGLMGPNYIEDPDSIVDRSQVLTARHIEAGDDANKEASFTIIEAWSHNSLAELQSYVATARSIVATERPKGYPVHCGDVQGDQIVNVGDVVYLVSYLYRGGLPPVCPEGRGDVNNDGIINVGDVVYLVSFLYRGGNPPDCPGIWY